MMRDSRAEVVAEQHLVRANYPRQESMYLPKAVMARCSLDTLPSSSLAE